MLAEFSYGLVWVGSLAFQNRPAGTLTGLGSGIVITNDDLHFLHWAKQSLDGFGLGFLLSILFSWIP